MVWLVLVDIISICSGKLLKDVSFLLPPHLFSVVSFLYFIVDLTMQLLLHVLWHVLVILKFAHSVDIKIFLVQFEWIEPMLSMVLHIDVGCSLLFCDLLLSLLEFFID